MGLFGMLEENDAAARIPIPKLNEMRKPELLALEKETMGIYISGHPMDDYRESLKNTHVMRIGSLLDEDAHFEDDQIVSVAGIVQSLKMKTTRNNSVMAYLTVEDDTGAMEMLAFSNVLSQYGGYLKEGAAVVITGRLSLRDDKEPQIVVNRARPISDYAENPDREPALHGGVLVDGQARLRRCQQNDPARLGHADDGGLVVLVEQLFDGQHLRLCPLDDLPDAGIHLIQPPLERHPGIGAHRAEIHRRKPVACIVHNAPSHDGIPRVDAQNSHSAIPFLL